MTRKEQSPLSMVYEGMRTWLMETGLRLQAADLHDNTESQQVREKIKWLLRAEALLTDTEEHAVFPLLMEKAPYLVCHFVQEHAEMVRLRMDVEQAEKALHHYPTPEQVAGLRLAYTSYMAFVLQHGLREESILVGAGLADMQEGGTDFGGSLLHQKFMQLDDASRKGRPAYLSVAA